MTFIVPSLISVLSSVAVSTLLLNVTLCKTTQASATRTLYLDPTRAHTRWNWKKASQLRDLLKARPSHEFADHVRRLTKLATYHNTLCQTEGEIVAGKWFWEIVKSCSNVKHLESPSRLQGSPILASEAINSASKLERLEITPLKWYKSSFIESHELVCSLRPLSKSLRSLHIATFGNHNSGLGRSTTSYQPTSDRPSFDLHEFSFTTNDFVEFVYPSFVPTNLASLHSLHLEGLFSHTVYSERFQNLQRLSELASSTLERLVIRTPAQKGRNTLDDHYLLRQQMSSSLQFDANVFFGTSTFPNLRLLHLEGIGYLSTGSFRLIACQCEEVEEISFANSIWDINEWWKNYRRVSRETCLSICSIMDSLSSLVYVHLGDLPVYGFEPAFQTIVRYCEEHNIELDFQTLLHEDDHCTPPSLCPASPSSSTVTSIGSSDSQASDPFFCYPFYRNSPFSDASSNNSYTSSMFWTETESTPSEYDSHEPMFDDPSYHAPLSPRSPSSRSPLYLPSSPDIPRLEDGYEAHDPDGDEHPIDYPTGDEAEEEVAQDKFYESWLEF